MTRVTPARRLARVMVRHATHVLPPVQAAWGRAMAGETEHLPSDRAALGWALSCLAGAYTMRISTLTTSDLRPSRPVLALEMLACFTWLAWLFASAVRQWIGQGPVPDATIAGLLLASLLGPVGLGAALVFLTGRVAALGPGARIALAALAAVALGTLGSGLLLSLAWRDYVLCVALPLAGTLHLLELGRAGGRLNPDAAPAA